MIYASRFLRKTRPTMVGPDVHWMKIALAKLDYLALDESVWEFDTQAEAAILKFQRLHNLIMDGVVGPSTYRALWTAQANVLTGVSAPTSPCEYPPILIHIDGGRSLLHCFIQGHLVESYPIALGSPHSPTPCGYWHVVAREVDPGELFGTRWLGLSVPFGAYGIHGTDNPEAIGKKATHGCIYMLNTDIETIFASTPINTPVLITGPAAISRLLEPGVLPGRDIQRVQSILQTLRLFTGHPDGHYTPSTATAVTTFQRQEGIEPSGSVCPYTFEALEKAFDIATGATRP